MLEKIKQNAIKAKNDRAKTKAEKQKVRLERQAEKTRKEQEQLAQEKAALEEEKQRLLSLSDKEIMVELVFAIRGFHQRMVDVEAKQQSLSDDVEGIESSISDLELEIANLKAKLDNND